MKITIYKRVIVLFLIVVITGSGLIYFLASSGSGTTAAQAAPTRAAPPAAAFATPGSEQESARPEPETAVHTVAIINGRSLDETGLTIARAADQAMAALAQQPYRPDPNLLPRIINVELVRQQADAAGFAISAGEAAAELQALLAAYGRSPQDLAAELNRYGVTLTQFEAYLARLMLVDRYTQAQSQAQGISPAAYLQQLQQAARISYGPAAQQTELAAVPSPTRPSALSSQPSAPSTEPAPPPLRPSAPPPTPESAAAAANIAPAFTLPLLNPDGAAEMFTLSDLRGRPVLLSFWTTWCPYCRAQTPVLVAGYEQYAAQGVAFVGVNVREAESVVAPYTAEEAIPYPVVLDGSGEVAAAYQVQGFPTTVVLDAGGQIVARHVGQLDSDSTARLLQAVLQTP